MTAGYKSLQVQSRVYGLQIFMYGLLIAKAGGVFSGGEGDQGILHFYKAVKEVHTFVPVRTGAFLIAKAQQEGTVGVTQDLFSINPFGALGEGDCFVSTGIMAVLAGFVGTGVDLHIPSAVLRTFLFGTGNEQSRGTVLNGFPEPFLPLEFVDFLSVLCLDL